MSDTTIDVPSSAVAIREPEPHAVNPLDLPVATFREGLDRRRENRTALIQWIRSALVEGVDFGSIKFKGRESKPSLWKPGAEKICGMLGVTPTFPNVQEYERAAISGVEIKSMLIRCEIQNASGQVVATGVGARSLSQDNGDLNKALKMCLKSAHIDATLRMAGLSEIFTQDLEDLPSTPPPAANTPPVSVPPPSRGELLQTLLVKLCPTDEVRNALTSFLRTQRDKSGKINLEPDQGLEKLSDDMLLSLVQKWSAIWPKVDAWHSGQVPGAEVPDAPQEPGYPFKPKDPAKAHYKGMTLKQLFEADSKFAFGIAMNFTAEPYTKDGKEYPPSPAVVAFAQVCEEWRQKQKDRAGDGPPDDFEY